MTLTPSRGLMDAPIASVDPEVWAAMVAERDRQFWKIELIASENYTSRAVMEANGSWLTNKYAEGQPGKRYYGGCEHVDVIERLAEERALALFPGSEFVNVQPHSGAQANIAAYLAVHLLAATPTEEPCAMTQLIPVAPAGAEAQTPPVLKELAFGAAMPPPLWRCMP